MAIRCCPTRRTWSVNGSERGSILAHISWSVNKVTASAEKGSPAKVADAFLSKDPKHTVHTDSSPFCVPSYPLPKITSFGFV
jgi:hypothetical protein